MLYANTNANSAEAPPRSSAPVSTKDRSGVGGSSDGQNEQSRIVSYFRRRGAALTLVRLSDAPWLNRRRPGSLYTIVEYE